MDFFEKEIYKLDKLLEEHLHFYYEIKLTSNIKKYFAKFFRGKPTCRRRDPRAAMSDRGPSGINICDPRHLSGG